MTGKIGTIKIIQNTNKLSKGSVIFFHGSGTKKTNLRK